MLAIVIFKIISQNNSSINTNQLNSIKISSQTYRDVQSFDKKQGYTYFSKDVLNKYSLAYIKFLQKKFFNSITMKEHLDDVLNYLLRTMPRDKAEGVFKLYKKYLNYQSDSVKEFKSNIKPQNHRDALGHLARLQKYRRNFFGSNTADVLFGLDLKITEFNIRKHNIIDDDNLYGAEKEKKLKELSSNLWSDENFSAEERTSSMEYHHLLKLYGKDLTEMTSQEKEAWIISKRKIYFSDDIINRLKTHDEKFK